MNRFCHTVAFVLLFSALALPGFSQQDTDISRLFAELNASESTNRATQEIIRIAAKDSASRDYIVERLPSLIDKPPVDWVWGNAVKLAGILKAANAVPALIRVLPESKADTGIQTFAFAWSVEQDPVGKSLYEIGDAAVPSLAGLLDHGDTRTKVRALRILWNIDSPASREAIQNDLNREKNENIKAIIRQAGLGRSGGTKIQSNPSSTR